MGESERMMKMWIKPFIAGACMGFVVGAVVVIVLAALMIDGGDEE